MALTIDFKETIQARVESDAEYRTTLLSGETKVGKSLLRDCINATIGFQELGGLTEKSPKSFMRMFGPNGNPQARNLFEIIGCLQKC